MSAIQPRSSNEVALPADLQAEITKMMNEDKGNAYDPLPLRAHIEKDRFWVTQKGNKEPLKKYEQLDVHIVYAVKWRGAYGTKDQKAPSCASQDAGHTGKLHADYGTNLPVQIPDGQDCATCPLNQWGTGQDENGNPTKGKFCGERRNLLTISPDFPEDALVVSIPTMSVGRWDAYADGLAKIAKTHYSTQMSRIGVEMKEGGGQSTYGAATFETLGMLPAATIAHGIEIRKKFRSMLGKIVVEEPAPIAEEEDPPF